MTCEAASIIREAIHALHMTAALIADETPTNRKAQAMTFELEELTKVRVLDVRVLSRKDRKPDEPPGAQLLLTATLAAGALAMFDGSMPSTMYRRPKERAQGELDGIETAELTTIGEHVKRMKWEYEQTGCTIEIDRGLGGGSNVVLNDCKAHRVSIQPQQKGVVIQWCIDAPGLSDATRGTLTGLKSTDVQMMMQAPRVDDGQAVIGLDPAPGLDATAAFVAGGALEERPGLRAV